MTQPVPASPVILLLFANDWQGPSARYLRNLPVERHRIEKALRRLPGVRVVTDANTTPEVLFDLLAEHNDDIVGFHFGGHADGSTLHFEQEDGTPEPLHRGGLAARLAALPALRWVFLNGCATAAQVRALHARCDAPVIATDRAIEDEAATAFADRFYRSLARHRSLREAFDDADAALRAKYGDSPTKAHRSGAPGPAHEAAADAPNARDASPDPPLRFAGPAGPAPARWPWVLEAHPAAPDAPDWRIAAPRHRRTRRAVILAVASVAAGLLVWQMPAVQGCFEEGFETVVLRGEVLDPEGAPIAGASVSADGTPLRVRTGADGAFVGQVGYMREGELLTLRVRRTGFEETEQTVQLDAAALELPSPIVLTPLPKGDADAPDR